MTTSNTMQPRRHAAGWRLGPILLGVNLAGLLLVAVWMRIRQLGTIPGINGDEAWYGVQVLELLRGGSITWTTPTGNPLNPFFFLPQLVAHSLFEPSFALLRSISVAAGLAALVINYVGCRWVFGRRTATVSTIMLAVLPITIAYSRFAWDASQSVAATLGVLYPSLAAVRPGAAVKRCVVMAVLALAAAVLVHPTNVFAGMAILVALTILTVRAASADPTGPWKRRAWVAAAGALLLAGIACAASPWPAAVLGRLLSPQEAALLIRHYPRLLLGGTVYRFIPGTRSWLQWPTGADPDALAADILLFWLAAALATSQVWRSWRIGKSPADAALLGAWGGMLGAFYLVAGPSAMAPHFERYAMCLVGVTTLLLARGAVLWAGRVGSYRKAAVAVAVGVAVAWFTVADYQRHYFVCFQRTGGLSHNTFRTAAVEPKEAAMRHILQETEMRHIQQNRSDRTTWIVTSEWWNLWPLRYLALNEPAAVRVETPRDAQGDGGFRRAMADGRAWQVEFADSRVPRADGAGSLAASDGWRILDNGRRPVLVLTRLAPQTTESGRAGALGE